MNRPAFLIIPAAGKGTRMKSVNPSLPKELIPVGPKPAIQYAIEEGIAAGIEQIIIIISPEKEIIKQRLRDCGFPINYLYQSNPTGESDAIGLAESIVRNHSLAIIYPDNLYLPAPGALSQLIDAYMKFNKDVIALGVVTEENSTTIGSAGQVDVHHECNNVYQIKYLHPKKQGHFNLRYKSELRACGLMVSGPHVFDIIHKVRPKIRQKEFTDETVKTMILKERGLLGLRLPGVVFDIGNPMGYCSCLKAISGNNSSIL